MVVDLCNGDKCYTGKGGQLHVTVYFVTLLNSCKLLVVIRIRSV